MEFWLNTMSPLIIGGGRHKFIKAMTLVSRRH